jgi:hypothetical protein
MISRTSIRRTARTHELRRRERVDVDRGKVRLDVPQQVLVPLDRQAVVHAALHQHLRAADGHQLADLVADLLVVSV